MLAVGGTEKMHRTVLSCVLRGHGPGDAAAEVSMKKMLRKVEAVLDASGERDNEKRGYVAQELLAPLRLAPKRAEGPDSRPFVRVLAQVGVRRSGKTSWDVSLLQDVDGMQGRRIGPGCVVAQRSRS